MYILICIIGILTGIAVGLLLSVHILSYAYFGVISWTFDEDGAYPFIEGDRPFHEIANHKYAVFKVKDLRSAYESSNGKDV